MSTITRPASSRQAPVQPTDPTFDPARVGAFMERLLNDLSGAMVSLLCAVGDRLGLFKDLAANGPTTSGTLAARTGIGERHAREWLATLASAGYLDYDPTSRQFSLPPEHAPALAQEGGPMFLGGGYQQLLGLVAPLEDMIRAFREGRGVSQEVYGEHLLAGMERMSATWFDNLLVDQWIPLVPDVKAALERGARVADVGCGSGRALIRLAEAFPNSRFEGFDGFGPVVARAEAKADAAGVAGRVRFQQCDVLQGLPGRFDLITLFDSLHDLADPGAGLAAVHRAIDVDGTCLVLEMNCSDELQENRGPVAALLYATSALYNLPVSLDQGGAGLGTMGVTEARLRQFAVTAGFRDVRRLPVMNPFNSLYELKP
jgi:SAM-dependent methyltransferase